MCPLFDREKETGEEEIGKSEFSSSPFIQFTEARSLHAYNMMIILSHLSAGENRKVVHSLSFFVCMM